MTTITYARLIIEAVFGCLGWIMAGPDVPIRDLPVSDAASAMAKEGARQRRETVEQKRARVHAELRAAVGAGQ